MFKFIKGDDVIWVKASSLTAARLKNPIRLIGYKYAGHK